MRDAALCAYLSVVGHETLGDGINLLLSQYWHSLIAAGEVGAYWVEDSEFSNTSGTCIMLANAHAIKDEVILITYRNPRDERGWTPS